MREITFSKKELIQFIRSKQPSHKKLNISDFWNGYEMALSDIEGFIETKDAERRRICDTN